MIWRVLHIAHREWLEQRRQPAMLTIMATLYVLVAFMVVGVLAALEWMTGVNPEAPFVARLLAGTALQGPRALHTVAESTVALFTFLMFTQFVGFAAVLCGHSMLHDRQCGTLTFLLLAPVRRWELLLGKVLGAISWALVLYLLVYAVGALLATSFDVARTDPRWLPLSVGWWLVFMGGAPAFALFTGSVCAVIGALARDVRTAQQGVWFVVFFATLGSALLLMSALEAGLSAQLATLALALTGAAATLGIGSVVVGRTVGR